MSFLHTAAGGRINTAVCLTGTVSAVLGWVSWVVTFTPWSRFMPAAYFVPFFVVTFPLFGWSLFVLPRYKVPRRRHPADMLQALPRRAQVLVAAAVPAAAVSFLSGLSGLQGQPEYDPRSGRYFYDDHGVLIPTTRASYMHAVAAQNRIFLGVALVFTSYAAAVTYGKRSRHSDRIGVSQGTAAAREEFQS
jgi:hypothetical protein